MNMNFQYPNNIANIKWKKFSQISIFQRMKKYNSVKAKSELAKKFRDCSLILSCDSNLE